MPSIAARRIYRFASICRWVNVQLLWAFLPVAQRSAFKPKGLTLGIAGVNTVYLQKLFLKRRALSYDYIF